MMNNNYLFSWLLLSIYYSLNFFKKTNINRLFSTGDMLNHAIFSFEEMEKGLACLIKNDLIKFYNPAKIVLTGQASQLIKTVLKKTIFPVDQIKVLSSMFDCGLFKIEYSDKCRVEGFSFEDYKAALNCYKEKRKDLKKKTVGGN